VLRCLGQESRTNISGGAKGDAKGGGKMAMMQAMMKMTMTGGKKKMW